MQQWIRQARGAHLVVISIQDQVRVTIHRKKGAMCLLYHPYNDFVANNADLQIGSSKR